QHQRLDLALAGGTQFLLDAGDRLFQPFDADRALFQRPQHAGAQLFLVEGLTAAVLLDQPRHDQVGCLEGGEALLASQAFTAPANLIALGRQPRVDDLGVIGGTEGTVHGCAHQKRKTAMVADRTPARQNRPGRLYSRPITANPEPAMRSSAAQPTALPDLDAPPHLQAALADL